MVKSDLKTGMLFECRNGEVFLLVGEFGINKDEFFDLESQNENLTYRDSSFDIVRVSEVLKVNRLLPKYWNKDTITENLLWEEKPIETIKIGEITYDKSEFENAVKNLKPIK